MINNKGLIIALSPGDTLVQIIPDFENTDKNTNKVISPDIESGYLIPLKFCLVDEYQELIQSENCKGRYPIFCGIFELGTIFFNEKIRRDVLDELYRDGVTFSLYIRQYPTTNETAQIGPKIIKTYHECYFYRQELVIPEVGLTNSFRYHFTNSEEPWEIPMERINELKPPNQYIYDYAVSKAIKNLQYPINDVCKALNNISEQKVITAKEYIELVNQKQE